MGLSETTMREHLDALAERDAAVRRWLPKAGYPPARSTAPGYAALLRVLVGQQLSMGAAATIYRRLEVSLGAVGDPRTLLEAGDALLRGAGLSRPKIVYARALAEAVRSGRRDLAAVPTLDDDAAAAAITAVKGFGAWSAAVYLMFAEGRPDFFPSNDLGLQEGLKRLLRLKERPDAARTATLGAKRAPYRTAFAHFVWHVYAVDSQAQPRGPRGA